ncbi:MAG: NAD(P)/FAD-dependent oxidoreductase [Candidatus Omnitrophica bacterium]|nr:NAD(P)/FAD-dependent oxidoreductase [Candidatus Omnitrophota bacterium]
MERVDITIIGAGIVGLAIGYKLSQSGKKNILVIDQHKSFGQETSSRNSEVIHAGLYYKPGSLKAKCCLRGNKLLYELCQKHNIPHKKLGKLVIAPTKEEIGKIENIYKNAIACGVENLTFLDKDQIRKLEPDVTAEMGILSPDTGIIDSHAAMKFFYETSKANGVEFGFGITAAVIRQCPSSYEIVVEEPDGEHFPFETTTVINCGGLWADKIAEMVGMDIDALDYRLRFNKGQYFRISNPKKFSVMRLIYPPPSKNGLGIHITPDLAGGLRLGPDDAWIDIINYDVNEADKEKFFTDVQSYLPALMLNDLAIDTAGVRPKLQKPNEAFHDFVISHEKDKRLENFINLIGIESPGLTSCLAIAEMVEGFIL